MIQAASKPVQGPTRCNVDVSGRDTCLANHFGMKDLRTSIESWRQRKRACNSRLDFVWKSAA